MRLLLIWWHTELFMEAVRKTAGGCTWTVYFDINGSSTICFLYILINTNKVLQGCGFSFLGWLFLFHACYAYVAVSGGDLRGSSHWLTLKGLFRGFISPIFEVKHKVTCWSFFVNLPCSHPTNSRMRMQLNYWYLKLILITSAPYQTQNLNVADLWRFFIVLTIPRLYLCGINKLLGFH